MHQTGASRPGQQERFPSQRGVGDEVAAALVSAEERRPEAARRSVSPLEEFAVEILDLITQRPDHDLGRNGCELRKRRVRLNRSCSGVFSTDTQHHAQKCCKQPNGSEQMWRERAAAGYESKVWQSPVQAVYRRDRRQHEHGETEREARGVRVIGAVPWPA